MDNYDAPPIERPGFVSAGVLPPHNIEAEQGLLGALLFDNRQMENVGDILRAEHFYSPVHRRIYSAIAGVIDRGGAATATLLKEQFENDGALADVGGKEYLAALLTAFVSPHNARHYAEQIRDLSLRRGLISISADLSADARLIDMARPAKDILSDAEANLFNMAESAALDAGPVPVSESMARTLNFIQRAQKGEIRGLPTGIRALDEKLHIAGGDLIIVAGRPGMGKTVMGLTAIHNMAMSGLRGLFFSLEMADDQLNMRFISRRTGMPVQPQQRENGLKTEDFRRVVEAGHALARLPITIDSTPGLSPAQIRARARRHMRRHGLDVIVIDYLGLMSAPPGYEGQKVNQLAEITKALKNTARELNVPIILLHQLSRQVEGREDKRPVLSDLRDSGAIEQDADIVLFLYREEYYLAHADPQRKSGESDEKFHERMHSHDEALERARGRADIIIGKFRQGEVGTAKVRFSGKRQCFYDEDYSFENEEVRV